MNNYEVVNGKLPEEFHRKHLINEATRVIEIRCGQCDEREQVSEKDLTLFEHTTLEDYAAKRFYINGWRYCLLPEYEIEGVFCAACIRDDEGEENNSLQQPREKTKDE